MRINKRFYNVNVIRFSHLWGELWKNSMNKLRRIWKLNKKEISRDRNVGEITIILISIQLSIVKKYQAKNKKLFGN